VRQQRVERALLPLAPLAKQACDFGSLRIHGATLPRLQPIPRQNRAQERREGILTASPR
jgi:hypothetical protein